MKKIRRCLLRGLLRSSSRDSTFLQSMTDAPLTVMNK